MHHDEQIKIGREAIEIALMNMSRQPFRDALATLLGCSPSEDAIKAFAERFPDRWAQAVAIMGRLSGYHEKLQVDTNMLSEIQNLSDSQLMTRLQEVDRQLAEHRDARNGSSDGREGR
jgi:hypothetical protein